MSVSNHYVLNQLSSTRLPSISQVLVKLLALCQDDRTSVTELARLIGQEPVMAQKILSVANSPAYIHTGPHVKLETSLTAIGTDMVRILVINESIFQSFRALSRNVRLDLRAFWHHSLTTAMIAYHTAGYMGYEDGDQAYLAGLLHDIGRLALMTVIPEKYASLFYRHDNKALYIQEVNSLGVTHADAGDWLIRYWKLDAAIAESVQCHHQPFDRIRDASPLVRVIHMANLLAHYDEESPMIAQLMPRYGLSQSTAREIMATVRQQVQQAADYLGIDISDIEPDIEEPANLPTLSDPADMNQEILSLLNSTEFSHFFMRQTSRTHLQNALVQAACNILKLNHALLFWYNPAENSYTCITADPLFQKCLGMRIPAHADSVMQMAMDQKQPFFITSINQLTTAEEKNLTLFADQPHWLLIPLSDANCSLGVLFGYLDPEQMHALRQKKWLFKNFTEQFMLAWHRLQETQKHIQQEAIPTGEKYRFSAEATSEANRSVTLIRNYLQFLNQKLQEQETPQNTAAVLKEEIAQLEQIMHDMVMPQHQESVPADMATLVSAAILKFRKAHPAVVIIEQRTVSEKNSVPHAPENLLRQILISLLRATLYAMKSESEIIITHGEQKERDGKPYYRLSVNYKEDPVSDIRRTPQKNRQDNKQQELHMSMVYSLLNQIHARTYSHSDINGVLFDILIPAHDKPEK